MEVLTDYFCTDLLDGGAEARNVPLHVQGSLYESGDHNLFA